MVKEPAKKSKAHEPIVKTSATHPVKPSVKVSKATSHKTKTVKIKHHHAKAYRKRHVASFGVFLVIGLGLIGAAARYNTQVNDGVRTAKNFLSSVFAPKAVVIDSVQSTYGFGVTYDSRKFYATGIDTATGDIFIGSELGVNRAYETIRMAPTLIDSKDSNSNLTIRYYPKDDLKDPSNLSAIEAMAIKEITAKATLQAKKSDTGNVTLGGKQFLKTNWVFQSDNKILSGFTPSFTTYSATVNNKAFVIEVINNIASSLKVNQYDDVLQSISFSGVKTSYILPTQDVELQTQKSRNLLESAFLGKLAYAASSAGSLSSEQVSSIYGPAVVKVFNLYCEDIYLDGKAAVTDVCDGGTGSGFFINSDGDIATNGHVADSSPKGLLISYAYEFYSRGSTKLLDFLITKAGITPSDLPNGTAKERGDYVFNRLYGIDDASITTQNSVSNLLVSLTKDSPDIKELSQLTLKRQEYPEQPTIKRAKFIAEDFRVVDGISKFHASDVAIIKIKGSDYPVTKLGNISALLQGANLIILGYPGNASNNGIVDPGKNTVTLTSGKVSSIKNALGSEKKLIETDTIIGHGNSGGPAFNDSGEVVGIATYTASKVGDGTYNYVRDVKDLIDLAGKSSVTISSTSKTQTQWESALSLFGKAHYSKSIKSFGAVKKLYPSHPRVDEFIAAANENIKNGKDVKDFPLVIVVAGGAALLIAAGVVAVMIIRHKKAHNVYKAHVTGGMMSPIPQGAAPQVVAYDPANIAAQKNVMTAAVQQPYQPQQVVAPQMPQTPVQPIGQAPMQPQMPMAAQPVVTQPTPIAVTQAPDPNGIQPNTIQQ